MKNFITLLCSFCLSSQLFAYTYYTCENLPIRWEASTANISASANGFPTGIWADALQSSINSLNQHPSNFWYTVSYGDTEINFQNGQSEIWWTTDDSVLNGAPARAFQYWDCFVGGPIRMLEVDIIFDPRVAFTPFTWKGNHLNYGGTFRPFQGTAIHELGHGVPLAHTNNTYNIMGDDWNHIYINGANIGSYFGEDAGNGANFLYGNWVYQDVAVTHWKYSGVDGEYSAHTQTQIYDSAGAPVTWSDMPNDRYYWVQPNQVIQVQFTLENNGLDQQTVNMGFYFSGDDLITTLDRLIGTATPTVSRDGVLTTTYWLTVPADALPGTNYYIGAIIDNNNALWEPNESNNATYVAIRVY